MYFVWITLFYCPEEELRSLCYLVSVVFVFTNYIPLTTPLYIDTDCKIIVVESIIFWVKVALTHIWPLKQGNLYHGQPLNYQSRFEFSHSSRSKCRLWPSQNCKNSHEHGGHVGSSIYGPTKSKLSH